MYIKRLGAVDLPTGEDQGTVEGSVMQVWECERFTWDGLRLEMEGPRGNHISIEDPDKRTNYYVMNDDGKTVDSFRGGGPRGRLNLL